MQRIFVGDVQGCADELVELVSRATAAFGEAFVLWIAGDLVNRGPDNRRPLELVRGLVEASFAMVHAAADPDWSLEDLVAIGNRVGSHLSASPEEARELLSADPETAPLTDALGRMTRCRSVTTEGGWSSDEPASPERAWHRVWASRRHDYALVYGHWARQGLHMDTGIRGLDTGCVHHGRGRDGFLTAWLPESSARAKGRRPFDLPDDRFWQIPAKRRYYAPVVR